MLYGLSMLYCGSLIKLGGLDGEGDSSKGLQQYWFPAFICGIGIATKITFAPLVILLALIATRTNFIKISLVVLAGLLFGILPIYEHVPKMLNWFYRLAAHSGIHGGGPAEIFDRNIFWSNLKLAASTFWLIFVAMGVLWCATGFANRPAVRATIIITTAIAAHVVMVIKHWGPTYMVPLLPVTSLLLVALFFSARHFSFVSSRNLSICVTGISLAMILYATQANEKIYDRLRTMHQEAQYFETQTTSALARFNNPLLIGAFNCTLSSCATWLGLLHTPHLQLRMSSISPNFAYFNVFNKRMHFPGLGEVADDMASELIDGAIKAGRPVVLISPNYTQLNYFELQLVGNNKMQSIFLVKGLSPRVH